MTFRIKDELVQVDNVWVREGEVEIFEDFGEEEAVDVRSRDCKTMGWNYLSKELLIDPPNGMLT